MNTVGTVLLNVFTGVHVLGYGLWVAEPPWTLPSAEVLQQHLQSAGFQDHPRMMVNAGICTEYSLDDLGSGREGANLLIEDNFQYVEWDGSRCWSSSLNA